MVLVQNHGFASIGSLSESLGSQRLAPLPVPALQAASTAKGFPVDLAANAASLGELGDRANDATDFANAIKEAKANAATTVIHVETEPPRQRPDSRSWWDVPVSVVARPTQEAYRNYSWWKTPQRSLIRPGP